MEMNKILARLKPEGKPRPRGKFGRLCRRIVLWPKFETLIMILIILNVILMGIEYHNQPAGKTYVEEMINYTVTLIFFVEVIIRVRRAAFSVRMGPAPHRSTPPCAHLLGKVSSLGMGVDSRLGYITYQHLNPGTPRSRRRGHGASTGSPSGTASTSSSPWPPLWTPRSASSSLAPWTLALSKCSASSGFRG